MEFGNTITRRKMRVFNPENGIYHLIVAPVQGRDAATCLLHEKKYH